jgi:hypothetical protein
VHNDYGSGRVREREASSAAEGDVHHGTMRSAKRLRTARGCHASHSARELLLDEIDKSRRGLDVVFGDVVPDLVKVCPRLREALVTATEPAARPSTNLSRW